MLKIIFALLIGMVLGTPAARAPRKHHCSALNPCAVYPVPVVPPARGL